MLCVGLGQNHQAATPYLKQLDLEVELPDENLEYSKNLCQLDVALILGVFVFVVCWFDHLHKKPMDP